jgi:hypothetical protein
VEHSCPKSALGDEEADDIATRQGAAEGEDFGPLVNLEVSNGHSTTKKCYDGGTRCACRVSERIKRSDYRERHTK